MPLGDGLKLVALPSVVETAPSRLRSVTFPPPSFVNEPPTYSVVPDSASA